MVDAFALEHIPASLAPAGNIDSSPNHFEVGVRSDGVNRFSTDKETNSDSTKKETEI